MNNINVCNSRHRRNLLDTSANFSPINFSLSNYSTDAQSKAMKDAFGETLLLNNINKLNLISDPLKKNLADSVITSSNMEMTKGYDNVDKPQSESLSTLSGITNFFSGVFNVMTGMFQKRTSSEVSQYFDCFDLENEKQMSPPLAWHSAKYEVQNKNGPADQFGCNGTNLNTSMTTTTVVSNCENKLNQVRMLLNDNKQQQQYRRRPRRVFIEPGSVEDSFEDACCPEDFVHLGNDTFIECYGAYNHHEQDLFETDAPFVKTEMCKESMDIVTNLPEDNEEIENTTSSDIDKEQIILSCEDKINKIKELLKTKHKPNDCLNGNDMNKATTSPIPIKVVTPNDISFDSEISNKSKDSETSNSVPENSFDEVTGKFYSSSADSDDSFQIVFADQRKRLPSDCESEDSYIVFEESPDSCYISNDVFGDENDSNSDSDLEEDSGYGIPTFKLNHSLSRTFGDLTDDSLYSADVVDCAARIGDEITDVCDEVIDDCAAEKSGLLLDEQRMLEKQKQPSKKVHFSPHPPKVHVMCVWAYAARQARAGHWERHALDRERFRRRIADADVAISWVLKPQHRSRVVFQRFMPWWNAQKRKELAEKREQEEQRLKEIEENTNNNYTIEDKNLINDVNKEEHGRSDVEDGGAEKGRQEDVVHIENVISGSEIEISQLETCDYDKGRKQLDIENMERAKELAIDGDSTSLNDGQQLEYIEPSKMMNVSEDLELKDAVINETEFNGINNNDAEGILKVINEEISNNEFEEYDNGVKIRMKNEEGEKKSSSLLEGRISEVKNIDLNGLVTGDAKVIKELNCMEIENTKTKLDILNCDSESNVEINNDIADLEIKQDVNGGKSYCTFKGKDT